MARINLNAAIVVWFFENSLPFGSADFPETGDNLPPRIFGKLGACRI